MKQPARCFRSGPVSLSVISRQLKRFQQSVSLLDVRLSVQASGDRQQQAAVPPQGQNGAVCIVAGAPGGAGVMQAELRGKACIGDGVDRKAGAVLQMVFAEGEAPAPPPPPPEGQGGAGVSISRAASQWPDTSIMRNRGRQSMAAAAVIRPQGVRSAFSSRGSIDAPL